MMLISQGASAAINLGKAAHQAHKANKLGATPRPEYNIPQSQIEALNNAKYMASQTELPGQNIMQQKIDQGSAGALSNLKDVSQSGSALGSNIANIYRGNVTGQNQLNLAAAQNFNNNQGILRTELNNMAPFEQKQWEINEFDKYKNNMAASSAMREGAFRNLSAAGSDIAAGVSGAANMKYWDNQLNPSKGGVKTGPASTVVPLTTTPTKGFNIMQKTPVASAALTSPTSPTLPATPAPALGGTTYKPLAQMTPEEVDSAYNTIMAKNYNDMTDEEKSLAASIILSRTK